MLLKKNVQMAENDDDFSPFYKNQDKYFLVWQFSYLEAFGSFFYVSSLCSVSKQSKT